MKNDIKPPPNSLETEQWILGGIMIDNKVINEVIGVLNPEDFYSPAHQKIFRAMIEMNAKEKPIDILTLNEHLKNNRILETVGDTEYLTKLSSDTPTTANVNYYVKIVRDKSLLRSIINVLHGIASEAGNGVEDVDEFIDNAERKVFEITRRKFKKPYHVLNEELKTGVEDIAKLYDAKSFSVPSGFKDLDHYLSGFQPSDLVIVAGRTSMGKTSLALNIAHRAALHDKVPVAIFTMEMSFKQVRMRILCTEADVSIQDIRTSKVTKEEILPQVIRAANRLSEAAPMIIDDTSAISTMEIRAKCRRMKAEHNIGLIVVDYLQLMRSRNRKDIREQEVAEVSRSLKAIAKELDVPVIALSQLNRSFATREDKRPRLSDLRESGAIEQDADIVFLIHRDDAYKKNSDNAGTAEIIIAKHRNGATGTVKLAFLKETMKFADLATDY